LRLFGPVAEAARTKVDEFDGSTIEEVLDAARDRYGTSFAEQIRVCRIWVNGDVPGAGTTLNETDEVALLPPVSGG
jgi:molybdopterin synthase sulfur carrier subunit